MTRSARLLLALCSAIVIAGTGALGVVAAPRTPAPVAPAVETARPSPAAAHVAPAKAAKTNGPVIGQHRSTPADGVQPGTRGSVVSTAKAMAAAAKLKGKPTARPALSVHSISGTVRNPSAVTIPDIDVYVCTATCSVDTVYDSMSTDGSGHWSLSVPDGFYVIEFDDPNYTYAVGWYSESGLTFNPGTASRVHVHGGPVGALDVVMQEWHLISGRVRNTSSVNVSGILVEGWIDGTYYYDETTGADGTYSLWMPSGDTTLFLYDSLGRYANGWWVNPGVSYFVADAVPVHVTTSDVINVNATLTAARKIKGKVMSPSALGLGGVFVAAFCNGEEAAWTHSATDGTYSLGVVPGSYTIVFRDQTGTYGWGWRGSPGFTYDEGQAGLVTVEAVDLTGINVTLPLARWISGVVTNTSSSDLANIEVDIYENGFFYEWTLTGLDGSFSMPVAPGIYQVGFYDDTWTYASGWYNSSGFKYWWTEAGPVDVTSASASGKNVQLPLASVPGAPTGVTGTGYNESALVWWEHPANRGGLDDLTYTVTSSPESKTCTSFIDKSCTVTGLTNGHTYTFKVTATNVLGTSVDSDASGDVTPSATPDAPINVTAFGFDGAIVVSWGAPADNGSPITGYTATAWGDGSKNCPATTELTCTIGGLTNGTYYFIAVTAMNINGTGPQGWAEGQVAPRIGDSFVPLTPNRVVSGISVTSKSHATFQVTGLLPGDATRNVPTNATAVTGILSEANATAAGWLALAPEPSDTSSTSTINFLAHDARATGVTVPLGSGGTLSVIYGAVAGKTVAATFDVTGYFVAGTSGSTYFSLTPNRLVDSRTATKTGILTGQLVAGTHKSFVVTGRTPTDVTKNVPAHAVAVTGTLTVVNQTAAGFLTLGPDPLNAPPTASLFFPKGDIRATGLTVKLAADGTLSVTFTSLASAKADVIFDVNGYFLPGESGAMYVPVTPNRLLDSRPLYKIGLTVAFKSHVAGTFQVTGRVPSDATKNVPAGAVAVTGILTVAVQSAAGWLSLTPLPNNYPTTSTLNFPLGDIRATGVTVPISSAGKLSVTYGAVAGATTHAIFDVSGYFLN